jgi:hypothetical protein
MDKELAGRSGLILEMYGAEAFCRDACTRFPELAAGLQENRDAVHAQMELLGGAVSEAIAREDEQAALAICAFVANALQQPRASSELANAVAISFVRLEDLMRRAAGRAVLRRCPDPVRQILEEEAARDCGPTTG